MRHLENGHCLQRHPTRHNSVLQAINATVEHLKPHWPILGSGSEAKDSLAGATSPSAAIEGLAELIRQGQLCGRKLVRPYPSPFVAQPKH